MLKLVCAGVGQLNKRVAERWLQLGGTEVVGFRYSDADPTLAFDQLSLDLSQNAWPDIGADYIVVALSARERTVDGYRLAYVEPICRLAESILSWPQLPKRVIVVSSTRVYGAHDGQIIDDEMVPQPIDEFGGLLHQMESLVAQLPVESTVVRLSGIYGPGRNWLKRQALAAIDSADTKNHWTNRIHIDDAAKAIVYLLRQEELKNSYIVSDTQPVPVVDMYNYFREREGLLPLNTVPDTTGGKRLMPSRLQAIGFQWQFPTAFSGGYDDDSVN